MSEALHTNEAAPLQPAPAVALIAPPDPIQALIRARFAAPDHRAPMLPEAAVEVLRLSQQADAGIDDIVLVLEKDTLLAGRVLELAQSAFYAGKSEPKTLVHAAGRLGIAALRNLVLEAAFHARVVRGTPFDGVLTLAHNHSLGVAHLCRMVARSLEGDADFAFMLGLLHEAGLIAALTVLSAERDARLCPDVIASVGAMHGAAGEFIAAQWKLPEPLRLAIANHHQPPRHPGAAVLALSEHLAELLGLGMPGFDGGGGADRLDAAFALFSIDEKGLQKLLGEGKKIVDLAIRG